MRLLHEGPDIQVLLGEIRAQHGASAKIVKAERVRTGGIAGFFAKQHFEVTLDVAEEDAATGTSFVKPQTSMTQISGSATGPANSLPTQRTAANRSAPTTSALDALIAAADEHDVAAASDDAAVVDPPLRTNELIYQAPSAGAPSDAFSTVLAKVTQWEESAAQRQEPPVAPPAEDELLFDPQLIAGLSQAAMGRSWKALDTPSAALGQHTAEPDSVVTTPQPAPAEPAPAPEPEGFSTPTPTLPEVDLPSPRPWEPHVLAAEELDAARIVRRPEPAAAPEPERVLPTPRAQEPVPVPPAPEPVVTTPVAPVAISADGLPAPRTRRERRERMAQRAKNSPVLGRLAELGLPQQFLSTLPAEPTTADLTAALSGLPRASSSRPEEGEVIAILVEPGEADAAGSRISRRWRMDRTSVAGGGGAVKLSGDKQAARLAAAARSNGEAQLMVLDAELNGFDAEWAGDILNAARPDRVLAVVDATRKPHDIDTWLTAITPMVDAILLVNTSSTATPAAVLSLGIPVSEIDGRPGTAAEWAGLLMSRVFEKAE